MLDGQETHDYGEATISRLPSRNLIFLLAEDQTDQRSESYRAAPGRATQIRPWQGRR